MSGTVTAGGAIFPRLKALGVEYVFVNSGTVHDRAEVLGDYHYLVAFSE